MDKLHGMMRNLKGERKSQGPKAPAHLTVFRDFVAHLDRMSRAAPHAARPKPARAVKRKAAKR